MASKSKKQLFVIFLTVFIDLVGFGMIIPLGPYLAKEYDASAFEVGLLMAIYSLFQFMVAPVWGQLSDRYGRRPIILMSLLGASLSHAIFGWAGSLSHLFIARGLAGAFGANISTAMAYIADVTPKEERSVGMGLVGAAFGLGFVLGPGIGGFFAQWDPALPAFVAAGICGFNFLLAFFVLNEPPKNSKASLQGVKHQNRFKKMVSHLQSPAVGPLIFCAFAMSMALAIMEAPLFLFVKDRFDWGLSTASYGFAYVGIVMAFTQGFLLRRVLKSWDESRLLLVGSLLFSLGLFLSGASQSIALLALAMTFLAVGSGLFNPSANGRISQLSDPSRQGEVMGVVQSLSALARIIGPPLGGYLYDSWGTGAPFFTGAFLGLSVFGGLLVLMRTKGPQISSTKPDPQAFTDLMFLGRYQVENILRNEVPYLFFDLQSGDDRKNLEAHPQWKSHSWIFQRAKQVPAEEAEKRFQSLTQAQDKNFPLMIICYDGQVSIQVAKRLEDSGHRNVFIVEGGAVGLLAEEI